MNPMQKQRKCRNCNEFFFPDYRNAKHQRYCGKPACRLASKSASQRRWLSKAGNGDQFRGSANVLRVQEWRKAHPGYWRKKPPPSGRAQVAGIQAVNPEQSSCNAPRVLPRTLQDVCLANDPAFIGLISMFTGTTLQDDIHSITRRLVDQGRNILGMGVPAVALKQPCSDYDHQTSLATGALAANPKQL
jgi:hypothetical protein